MNPQLFPPPAPAAARVPAAPRTGLGDASVTTTATNAVSTVGAIVVSTAVGAAVGAILGFAYDNRPRKGAIIGGLIGGGVATAEALL